MNDKQTVFQLAQIAPCQWCNKTGLKIVSSCGRSRQYQCAAKCGYEAKLSDQDFFDIYLAEQG